VDKAEKQVVQTEVTLLAVRGVIAILFGIAALFWPDLTAKTFIYIFSAFVLVSGVATLIGGFTNLYGAHRSVMTRIFTVLLGAFEIGVGVYLIRHPLVSFGALIVLIGFVLIIRGIVEAIEVLFEDASGSHKVFTVIAGIVSVIVGIIMLFQPAAGGLAFVWLLGLYALITGPLLIALALALRSEADKLEVSTSKK
jgi:uncharacterized membrane protein HdeD (DUF308 family)